MKEKKNFREKENVISDLLSKYIDDLNHGRHSEVLDIMNRKSDLEKELKPLIKAVELVHVLKGVPEISDEAFANYCKDIKEYFAEREDVLKHIDRMRDVLLPSISFGQIIQKSMREQDFKYGDIATELNVSSDEIESITTDKYDLIEFGADKIAKLVFVLQLPFELARNAIRNTLYKSIKFTKPVERAVFGRTEKDQTPKEKEKALLEGLSEEVVDEDKKEKIINNFIEDLEEEYSLLSQQTEENNDADPLL